MIDKKRIEYRCIGSHFDRRKALNVHTKRIRLFLLCCSCWQLKKIQRHKSVENFNTAVILTPVNLKELRFTYKRCGYPEKYTAVHGPDVIRCIKQKEYLALMHTYLRKLLRKTTFNT